MPGTSQYCLSVSVCHCYPDVRRVPRGDAGERAHETCKWIFGPVMGHPMDLAEEGHAC